MYATCLFCHAALGANKSIEHFPVGKRLAFDAAKGRLWVMCTKCARWNLSPLDERWEAIDEAEGAYRGSKKRVATDNIGLARLNDGTDLIRIGAPMRSEFAAWRYGRSFVGRRWRELATGVGVGVGVIAAFAVATPLVSTAVVSGGAFAAIQFTARRGLWNPGVRTIVDDGSLLRVTGLMLQMSSIIRQPNGEFCVNVIRRTQHPNVLRPWGKRTSFTIETAPYLAARFTGAEAKRVLSVLMPAINRYGGASSEVDRAVQLIEQCGSSPTQLLANLTTADVAAARRQTKHASMELLLLDHLPAATRLALEMSLHEDSERRALEGELHELAQRWKEADEIAAIADSLTLPDAAVARFEELRRTK